MQNIKSYISGHKKAAASALLLFLSLLAFIFMPLVAKAEIRVTSNDMVDGVLTITVEFDELYERQAPETFNYTYEGVEYTLSLVSATYQETVIRNRGINLKADAYYDSFSGVPAPPEKQDIVYHDKGSGEDIPGVVEFVSMEQLTEYEWYNDLELHAVFYNYDAKYYSFHEAWIENNDAGYPEIQGLEWYILQNIGLDPNYNRIERAVWDGEPYQVEDESVNERKAIFYGSRYAADFVAHYTATLKLPDCDGFKAIAIYQVDTSQGGRNGGGEGEDDYQDTTNFWEWLFNTVVGRTVAVVGLLILIVGIIFILLILARKRKEENEKEPPDGGGDKADAGADTQSGGADDA